MAKLGWEISTKNSSLWCQIMRGKYINISHSTQSYSPIWKAICKNRNLIEKGTRWIIRNGQTANIWEDNWLGKGPLLDQLVDLSLLMKFLSQSSISSRMMDPGIYRIFLSSFLITSLKPFKQLSYNFTHTKMNDTRAWGKGSAGRFTIREAYQISKNVKEDANQNLKWIWKTPTHPKIKNLFWIIVQQRVIKRT